ncbi:tRNA-splicing endonuclease subunit Sen54-like [Ciona intestinalis]
MECSDEEGRLDTLDKFKKDDVTKSKVILENRPGFAVPLPTVKGGAKFSEFGGTVQESLRLQAYYDAEDTILSSWKVRKLANLGRAEWLPEYSVAKILKQGKFMQTKSHLHEKGFFALFPEECLFLLDVGDIELYYKGLELSMQDAYTLLLCPVPENLRCTLDEYQVYAYLCRVGYRVQRYSLNINNALSDKPLAVCEKKVETNHENKQTLDKKHALEDDPLVQSNLNETKRQRKTEESETFLTKSDLHKSIDDNCQYRHWWQTEFQSNTANIVRNKETTPCHFHKCTFPNFAELQSPTLTFPDITLLPFKLHLTEHTMPNIWHERLKRDDNIANTFTAADYSHPKHIVYSEICRKASNWSQYKAMVTEAVNFRDTEMKNLHKLMNSGKVKPLNQPNQAHSTKCILNQLNVLSTAEVQTSTAKHSTMNKIKFNVFQIDTVKPFRRTKPGQPFLRVIISATQHSLPTLSEICAINSVSDGIPVKVAIMEHGKPIFFGFDNIDIPTDVFG